MPCPMFFAAILECEQECGLWQFCLQQFRHLIHVSGLVVTAITLYAVAVANAVL